MEKTVIKLGIGISLPLTILACYAAGQIGVVIGKYEAYREIVNKKSDNDKED